MDCDVGLRFLPAAVFAAALASTVGATSWIAWLRLSRGLPVNSDLDRSERDVQVLRRVERRNELLFAVETRRRVGQRHTRRQQRRHFGKERRVRRNAIGQARPRRRDIGAGLASRRLRRRLRINRRLQVVDGLREVVVLGAGQLGLEIRKGDA